jgi:hypothetical protein
MSTKLRAAVESTIEKRHAAGTARCPPLNLDCFFAAMMNLLKGQAALQADLDASSRVESPDHVAHHRRPSGSNLQAGR